MAWTTPRTWTDTEFVTASIMNAHIRDNFNAVGPVMRVRKSSDQSVTSSTTLVDDTVLKFSVTSGDTWFVSLDLLYQGASTGDIKMAWTGGTGSISGPWGVMGISTAASGPPSTSMTFQGQTSPATTLSLGAITGFGIPARVFGTFTASGTTPTITFQWAQNTSDVTATTVMTNSTIIAYKVS